jgi:rubrerythrin
MVLAMIENSFIVWLYSELMEEVNGHKEYKEISDKLKMKGHNEYSEIFSKMAEQEKGHADYIMKILKDIVDKQDLKDNSLKDFIIELNTTVSKSI